MISVDIPIAEAIGQEIGQMVNDDLDLHPTYLPEEAIDRLIESAADTVAERRYGRLPVSVQLRGDLVTQMTFTFDDTREAFVFRMRHG